MFIVHCLSVSFVETAARRTCRYSAIYLHRELYMCDKMLTVVNLYFTHNSGTIDSDYLFKEGCVQWALLYSRGFIYTVHLCIFKVFFFFFLSDQKPHGLSLSVAIGREILFKVGIEVKAVNVVSYSCWYYSNARRYLYE